MNAPSSKILSVSSISDLKFKDEAAEALFSDPLGGTGSSGLMFDDEAITLVIDGLAAEVQGFALTHGVTHLSIDEQLAFVEGILDGNLGNFVCFTSVPTPDARCLAAVRVRFCPQVYCALALAAKHSVARSFNIDSNVFTECSHGLTPQVSCDCGAKGPHASLLANIVSGDASSGGVLS